MLFGDRELDVDGGQEGEDVGLQQGDEDLEGEVEDPEHDVPTPRAPKRLPCGSSVKKKNEVAAKNSASSRWPDDHVHQQSQVSVIGRTMKVDRISSGVSRK